MKEKYYQHGGTKIKNMKDIFHKKEKTQNANSRKNISFDWLQLGEQQGPLSKY